MRMPWSGLMIATLLVVAASPLRAQAGDAAPITAVPLLPGETIKLDGSLAHPAWLRAPVFTGFIERAPRNGAQPSHDTAVQVLFDAQALYVGVRACDPQPEQMRHMLVRRDNVNRTQDFVAVYIDAIGARNAAQFFRVNAAGSLADGMHTAADDNEDFSPDYDFDAATQRDPAGWTAVLRIPFASLRFADNLGSGWRIMVARRIPREQFHLITTVPIALDAPSFIVNLQPLLGLQLADHQRFLSLRPSLTLRRERASFNGVPLQRGQGFDASLDLKWRPLPQLVVDATLNPDFSQIELDVPQLSGNSRFALFFPEKRPFFFESSDLLRSPTDAMYTRSLTEPRWGLRSTWRGAQVAATAFAIDDRGGGLTLLPGPYATDAAEQPASTTLAARVRADVAPVQWGALLAARRYADRRGDNWVLGPDFSWQIDSAWRARGQWLVSDTTALPDAAGGLAQGSARRGTRALLKTTHQTKRSEFNFSVDDIGADFRHDTGFVNQAGVRKFELHQGVGWRQLGPLNELWFNLDASQTRERGNGQRVQEFVTPSLWMAGPSNFELTLAYRGHSLQRSAANQPLLDENYWKADLVLTPAPWIPFVEAGLSWGDLADVVANQVRPGGRSYLTMRTRPLARLEIEPNLSAAWLKRDGQRTYQESVARLLAVWHFDARQNLRAIVQRSTLERAAEPGVTSARDSASVASLTYSWRRSLGTVLYVGASRSRSGVTDLTRASEAFVKLQVDVDDVRSGW